MDKNEQELNKTIEIMNMRDIKPTQLFDVRVDRMSIFGNPFPETKTEDRNIVCDKYETYFHNRLGDDKEFQMGMKIMIKLYNKHKRLRLFCWCTPLRCHAETIKRWLIKELGR